MNASFANQITIPEGFATVLADFTREILREQPNNLYSYGAEYFQQLADEQYHPDIGGQIFDIESLQSRIIDQFNAADEEGKGYLTRSQATLVVEKVASELKFTVRFDYFPYFFSTPPSPNTFRSQHPTAH